MKKFFVFICLILISFVFVGCGGETPEQPDDKKPEFTLKEDSFEIYVGETYEIKVDTKNFGENDKLEYKSEDESILKLEGNIISALKVGTTKVLVKFVSETDATCPDNAEMIQLQKKKKKKKKSRGGRKEKDTGRSNFLISSLGHKSIKR